MLANWSHSSAPRHCLMVLTISLEGGTDTAETSCISIKGFAPSRRLGALRLSCEADTDVYIPGQVKSILVWRFLFCRLQQTISSTPYLEERSCPAHARCRSAIASSLGALAQRHVHATALFNPDDFFGFLLMMFRHLSTSLQCYLSNLPTRRILCVSCS